MQNNKALHSELLTELSSRFLSRNEFNVIFPSNAGPYKTIYQISLYQVQSYCLGQHFWTQIAPEKKFDDQQLIIFWLIWVI